MAKTDRNPAQRPHRTRQPAYAGMHRRPEAPEQVPRPARAGPDHSGARLCDFLCDSLARAEQEEGGGLGVVVLFLGERAEILGWERDAPHEDERDSWLAGWAELYPQGRAAALRRIAGRAFRLGASGIAIGTDVWLPCPGGWKAVALALQDASAALAPLGIQVLDFFLFGEGADKGMALSGFANGYWGGHASRGGFALDLEAAAA